MWLSGMSRSGGSVWAAGGRWALNPAWRQGQGQGQGRGLEVALALGLEEGQRPLKQGLGGGIPGRRHGFGKSRDSGDLVLPWTESRCGDR